MVLYTVSRIILTAKLLLWFCLVYAYAENVDDLSLSEMIRRLIDMNKPVVNDDRQNRYCRYINRFLSHFGNERCVVAGSSQELTRLRSNQDEGDYDYLIISEILIPTEALEYRDDLPCFVNIHGLGLTEKFPHLDLLEGKYLPTSLLTEIRPHAFKHIKHFHQIFSRFGSKRGHNTINVALDHRIKPGKSLVTYIDVDCPELGIELKRKQKDPTEIKRYMYDKFEEENFDGKEVVIQKLRNVASMVNEYSNIIPNEDEKESYLKQDLGNVIDALDENKIPPTQKSFAGGEVHNSELFDKLHKTYVNLDSCSGDTCGIILKYRSKSSKDFIPVFPLSGKPKFLDEWKNRNRLWPPEHVINDIYNSEFFVVAKPALTNPNRPKDFCLAYNNGEIKLARAMTPIQKQVVLIIKALKRSILRDYSDIVTTFHWKTALYWISEVVDYTSLIDSEDNVLTLLKTVLNYMVECLKKQDLQHYFIPSNLFANMDKETSLKIADEIERVKENPVQALRKFFIRENTNVIKIQRIPVERVEEFRKAANDPRESSNIEIILSVLRKFSSEKTETLKTALRDVVTDALPYFIEDEARGRDKDQINLHLIGNLLSNTVSQQKLIDGFINVLLGQANDESSVDASEIARNFLSLVLQEVLKN